MIIKIIVFIIILGSLIVVGCSASERNSTTYRSFVTDGLGFYKIRNIEAPPVPFTYEDRTLNINQGDTIIWINDADAATITVVSDQNLWNDKVGQIKVGATINYKFDVTGTYTFHLKGSSMRQTINVEGTGDTIHSPTYTEEPSPTYTEEPSPTYTENRPSPTYTENSPIPVHTQISEQNDTNTSIHNLISINIPIKITGTTVISILVAMFSIYVARRSGKK